jgi:DNA-binding NarL/FixJ family response regulator
MNARIRTFLPVLLILGVSLSACGGGDGPSDVLSEAVSPITVQLKWTHQAQFAGFYAADQNGYYADEGLEVSFVEGGPDIDGLEATRRIRASEADGEVPIIALTSYAMAGDREKALAAGCTDYIEKPINPETFIAQIEESL